MRILILTNLYPPDAVGGYEQACRDMAQGLRERGHHVEVLTSTYGPLPRPLAHGAYRLLRRDPFWAEEVDQAGGIATVQGARDGVSGRRFSPRQSLRQLRAWGRTFWRSACNDRALRALLRASRPDVIYVWNMRGIPTSVLTMAHRTGIPMVFNLQDYWLFEHERGDRWLSLWARAPRSPAMRAAHKLARPLAHALLPTTFPELASQSAQYASRAFAALYAEKGWRFARERVIYNGIDANLFAPAAREPRAAPCKLLFVGRLNVEKGAHVAIEALALLVGDLGRDAVTLTVVGTSGDVAYRDGLQRMTRDLGVVELVDFRGGVLREATPALYAAHDIMLFPSSWMEGFSLVLLEALACGLPVVGTTTGGSAELLEDGVTGLAVPRGDAAALADGARRLIGDPALARRLGEQGTEVVRRRFDRSRIAGQVEAFLREAVEGAP